MAHDAPTLYSSSNFPAAQRSRRPAGGRTVHGHTRPDSLHLQGNQIRLGTAQQTNTAALHTLLRSEILSSPVRRPSADDRPEVSPSNVYSTSMGVTRGIWPGHRLRGRKLVFGAVFTVLCSFGYPLNCPLTVTGLPQVRNCPHARLFPVVPSYPMLGLGDR